MGSQKNLVFAVVLENWRNRVPILMKLKNWIKITDPEAYDWKEIVAIEHELLRGFDLLKEILKKSRLTFENDEKIPFQMKAIMDDAHTATLKDIEEHCDRIHFRIKSPDIYFRVLADHLDFIDSSISLFGDEKIQQFIYENYN